MSLRPRQRRWITALLLAGAAVALIAAAGPDSRPVHEPYRPPDRHHVLGTDASGRDIMALLMTASATSLAISLSAALGATLIGALVGGAAGYWRSVADDVLMRLADIFLVIPTLPLVIVLAAYLGSGAVHVTLVIALTGWPSTARVIRARVLALRDRPFVVNARSMGAGAFYLICRHILPNCSELLLAKTALAVAAAMLAEAGIGFLGLADPVHLPGAASFTMPSRERPCSMGTGGGACRRWPASAVACWLLPSPGRLWQGNGPRGPGKKPTRVAPPEQAADETGQRPAILAIDNLSIRFAGPVGADTAVVDELNLKVAPGERVAVIWATGSGRSLLLLAVLGLLPDEAFVAGMIRVSGRNLDALGQTDKRRWRGLTAAYVPQSIGEALNPVLTVGRQVAERLQVHGRLSCSAARSRARYGLAGVGLADPDKVFRSYPHHLRGGMKQRALLAMALVADPALVLADEPTKGLGPAAVDGIVGVFMALKEQALLAVTHDLDFAQALGGSVVVMYQGIVVEQGPVGAFFASPLHPYSRALVAAWSGKARVDAVMVRPEEGDAVGAGCPWRPMCSLADASCRQRPPLYPGQGHRVRCWRHVP